ncbi:dTDP-4-dehydrorhamnose 3,5-epimerase [[Flexibacter] sp. ATCC 35103]|uniref:dTDP-4-dehydrorhamnose 3,5-epimerase n=1 Tax=[Flexibacter] sp. ATCC 35103 TaxID=1937528 RepID=UPI0009D06EA3|nr:dTDP-4-dehydrorhamnose 3,5-epimerase [[Flexibacter] sp. ATCC 35103]OMQ09840.1 dTDP-4-dehydrorhamnose 3,5-epimerase [[Flexibacter] sp. ATCC 35103]
MEIIDTEFNDLFVIEYKTFRDHRGEFVKTIHKDLFIEKNLNWSFEESFFSVSNKDVFRGMHFQYAPHDHDKLVYVIKGKILDIVVDLRSFSPTYGKYLKIELSEDNRKALYIGKGFAHGFLSLEENTIVEYHTSTMQNKESEGGIKWDSVGFNLPIKDIIISERDSDFLPFDINKKYF